METRANKRKRENKNIDHAEQDGPWEQISWSEEYEHLFILFLYSANNDIKDNIKQDQ